jgi:hypothetical protein
MNSALRWGLLGLTVVLVGCQPVTYQVKIINNSPFVTDFGIDSGDSMPITYVENLAANGGFTTVSHTGLGNLAGVDTVTIASGTLVGSQLTPIDAQVTVDVTANDLVVATKAAGGGMSATVTAARTARKK